MLVLPSASVDDLLDWEAVQPLQRHGFVYLTPLMMYVQDRVLQPEKQDSAWHSPKGSGVDLSGSKLPKCLAADKIPLHCLSRLSKHTFPQQVKAPPSAAVHVVPHCLPWSEGQMLELPLHVSCKSQL